MLYSLGRPLGIALVLALLMLLPMAISSHFYLHMLVMAAINCVLALSLNLILGLAGEKSLGHAAFFGLGAYAAAIVGLRFTSAAWATLGASGLAAGLGGLAIGYPSLRLRGPYFAIVTLGFVLILQLLATNQVQLTGGPMGLPGVPPATIGSWRFYTERHYLYAALGLAVVTTWLSWAITRSRLGRALVAIRENPDLAESVGISGFHAKLVAFVIGAVLAGLSGGVYAHYMAFVSPKVFDTFLNVMIVSMVIIGGEGTTVGPILGALIVTALPEVLRFSEAYRMLFFGCVLLAAIMFAPAGLMGLVRGSLGPLYQRALGGSKRASVAG